MRSWLLISLLLLSFIIPEAQGIRLRRGSMLEREHDIHETLSRNRKTDGVEECRGKHCSGRIRKLMISPISSTSVTNDKNDKNEENKGHSKMEVELSSNKKVGKKEENLSVNSSSITDQQQPAAPEPYPDILDIAGMDYSQARRKPPIHN